MLNPPTNKRPKERTSQIDYYIMETTITIGKLGTKPRCRRGKKIKTYKIT